MGKYLSSLSNLFPTLLATIIFLLLLIYAQPLYSKDLRTVRVLDGDEVKTISEVVSKLNLRPLLFIDKFLCHDKSTGIDCNCRMHDLEGKCVKDKYGKQECRNHTTCHIRSINLSGQQLNGEITSSIGNLTYLEDLDLSSNYIVGTIPKELGLLKLLKKLILYRNYLTGSIPNELCGMNSLRQLHLGANKLYGEIPEELGNITSLRHLTLSSNQLEGKIPQQLGKLVYLRTLALADNAFNGTLPELFYNLTRMQNFDVMGNNFSGPLPNYIWKWKKLSRFNLLGNNFEGPLDAISESRNLVSLKISDLKDTRGKGFPFPNISKLTSLETLILRSCSIVGEIDECIGTFSSLKNIDLSFNHLSGALPKNINRLQLDSIYLTGNNLSGSIPNWGEQWKKMNADFSHNNFSYVTFKYSEDMSSYLNLYACCNSATPNLDFEWEKSNFTCPANTRKSKNSQLFINCGGNETEVNDNKYEADLLKFGGSSIYVSKDYTWAYSSTGSFLGSGGGLTDYVQGTSYLDLEDALLYTTARISPMSLKYYGFCLKNDNYTVKLYFNEIVFTNDSDYGVNAKRVFDVFIQGQPVLKNFDIRKEANGTRKGLVKTFYALVGNNILEIRFYWAGTGSIYIPPGLYGPLVSAISVTPVPRHTNKLTTGQIVGIAGSSFFVMALVLAFLQKMGWLGIALSVSDSMAQRGTHNFPQVDDATQNFNSDNKIGEGGSGEVYKGELSLEGSIAVKRCVSNSKEGKQKFKNELAILTGLDHPNLVKLLGSCWKHNQLLLIYEFMENNSLYTALFGAGNSDLKSRLNWQARFKICLGIAKGLAYLHDESNEHSNRKIIHGNIKPTNILLDEDLNAKLSGFGLAKHHEEKPALGTEVEGDGNSGLKSRLNWKPSFNICLGIANGLAYLYNESSELSCSGSAEYDKEKPALGTKVGGTSFYAAPEYAMHGLLTYKSDVYNFGVVMLEIVSGKASADYKPNDETTYLLNQASLLEKNGKLLDLIDSDLKKNYEVISQAEMVLKLAMLCTKLTPAIRPNMSQVVSVLEGKTDLESISGPEVVPSNSDDGFPPKASLSKLKSF